MKIEKKGQFLIINEYIKQYESHKFYKIKISAISVIAYYNSKHGSEIGLVADGQWFRLESGTLEDRDKLMEFIK